MECVDSGVLHLALVIVLRVISGFRDGIGQGFDLGFCVDVDSYLVE